jgi:hypothetical protein
MLSVYLPFQVLKKLNNFWEIWYKFYTTRSIEESVYVLFFPHYTTQIQTYSL